MQSHADMDDQRGYDGLYSVTKRTELNYAHNLNCEIKRNRKKIASNNSSLDGIQTKPSSILVQCSSI